MTGKMRQGWFNATSETDEEAYYAFAAHQAAMAEVETT